jgi:hypothetical protein
MDGSGAFLTDIELSQVERCPDRSRRRNMPISGVLERPLSFPDVVLGQVVEPYR